MRVFTAFVGLSGVTALGLLGYAFATDSWAPSDTPVAAQAAESIDWRTEQEHTDPARYPFRLPYSFGTMKVEAKDYGIDAVPPDWAVPGKVYRRVALRFWNDTAFPVDVERDMRIVAENGRRTALVNIMDEGPEVPPRGYADFITGIEFDAGYTGPLVLSITPGEGYSTVTFRSDAP